MAGERILTSAELKELGWDIEVLRAVKEGGRDGPYIVNPRRRAEAIRRDICPQCLGELDTGYECNDCGFDCRPELEPDHD